MWRVDSLEKTLMLGEIEGRRRRDDRGWDGWMASPTRWTWFWVNSRSWWWTGRPGVLRFMGSQRVGHDWATELNRTEPCNLLPQCHNTSRFYSKPASLWQGVLAVRKSIQGDRVWVETDTHRPKAPQWFLSESVCISRGYWEFTFRPLQ